MFLILIILACHLIAFIPACLSSKGDVFFNYFWFKEIKPKIKKIEKEKNIMYIEKKINDIFTGDTIIVSEKFTWRKSCDIVGVLNIIKDIGKIISVNDTIESYSGRKVYGIDQSDYCYEEEIRSVCLVIFEIEQKLYDRLPKNNNNRILWEEIETIENFNNIENNNYFDYE